MTQEDKQLLFIDLCSRLPYGVKVKCGSEILTLNINWLQMFQYHLDEIKPYLRPMSSMTEEEREEFENLLEGIVDGIERWDKPDLCEEYDWLNAHHFDYRGLIDKGLALEAPKEMYMSYNEKHPTTKDIIKKRDESIRKYGHFFKKKDE